MLVAARALVRLIGGAALLAFAATAFTSLPSDLDRMLDLDDRLEAADAIVVLGGGGLRGDAQLSDVSLRRLIRGITLFQEGLAPLLVVAGGEHRGASRSEAEIRARVARSFGIPDSAILTESSGRRTLEEAAGMAKLLHPHGIQRILLVVDRQGMRRATALFQRAGFEVLPAATDDVSSAATTPEARLALMQRILIEITALFYHRLIGAL
jgi:uncharacterized SAM-binding protein YcdF (DUF218 family)